MNKSKTINVTNFLPDFSECPLVDKKTGEFSALFRGDTLYVHDSEGLILSALEMELNGKTPSKQYFATIHIDPIKSKPIHKLINLIQKHVAGADEHDQLPLVLEGTFRVGEEHHGPFEKFKPAVLIDLKAVIIAFLKVPFDQLEKRESEIINRLSSYIQI